MKKFDDSDDFISVYYDSFEEAEQYKARIMPGMKVFDRYDGEYMTISSDDGMHTEFSVVSLVTGQIMAIQFLQFPVHVVGLFDE